MLARGAGESQRRSVAGSGRGSTRRTIASISIRFFLIRSTSEAYEDAWMMRLN